MPDKDEETELLIEKSLPGDEPFWEKVEKKGTPLIVQRENGTYDAIFLYQEATPGQNIYIKSEDLRDRMLDEKTGEPSKLYQKANSDVYYLRVQNVPEDTCVKYAFNKGVPDQYNKSKNEDDSYLQMPAGGPPIVTVKNSEISSFVNHNEKEPKVRELKLGHGLLQNLKDERELFIYKPDGYDGLEADERKVVFVLDGKEFAKLMIPTIDAATENRNTAFVFVEPMAYKGLNYPNRVHEYYYNVDKFSDEMVLTIIPNCCTELKAHPNNTMIAAHSLAVYPALEIAKKSPQMAGIILASPAINKNREPTIPPEGLPIYMQVGQLENVKPPEVVQHNEDTKNSSILEACVEFHAMLENSAHTVSDLNIHLYGHGNEHVLEAVFQGMQYIEEQKLQKVHSNTEKLISPHDSKVNNTTAFKEKYHKICEEGLRAKAEHPVHLEFSELEEKTTSPSPLNTSFKPH